MSNSDTINRGVELMLRRGKSNPVKEKKGLIIQKTLSLLNKKIQIRFEFTWERQ